MALKKSKHASERLLVKQKDVNVNDNKNPISFKYYYCLPFN